MLIEPLKKIFKSKFILKNALYGCFIVIVLLPFLYFFNIWFDSFKIIKVSYLNLFVAISGLILTFLALFDDFSKKTKLSFLKSLFLKFVLIIMAGDLAFVSSNKKDEQSNNEQTIQRKSDSLYKVQQGQIQNNFEQQTKKGYLDSLNLGLKKMANIFISGLNSSAAQNGADLEHAKKQISRLVEDSAKRVEKYYQTIKPVLDARVVFTKLTGDSLFFQVKLDCTEATAYELNILINIAYIDGKGFFVHYYKVDKTFATKEFITPPNFRTAYIELPNFDKKNLIFFYLNGSYKESPDSEPIKFDKIVQYDIVKKQAGRVRPEIIDTLRKLLKFDIK